MEGKLGNLQQYYRWLENILKFTFKNFTRLGRSIETPILATEKFYEPRK